MLNGNIGFAFIGSTSSTSGSFLLLANRRRRSGPGLVPQVGKGVPKEELLLKLKNRLCGVEMVAVGRSDLTECRASESTYKMRTDYITIYTKKAVEVVEFCCLLLY